MYFWDLHMKIKFGNQLIKNPIYILRGSNTPQNTFRGTDWPTIAIPTPGHGTVATAPPREASAAPRGASATSTRILFNLESVYVVVHGMPDHTGPCMFPEV